MNYAVSSGLRKGSFKSPPAYRGNTYHGCRAKTPIFYSAFWADVAELAVQLAGRECPHLPYRLRQLRPYPGGPIKRPAIAPTLAPTTKTIKPP